MIINNLISFFCFTGADHEEYFRLGFPDNCSSSAWRVRYLLAYSTRIKQSTERWRCSSHKCQQTVWFTGRWNSSVYPHDSANNLKRFSFRLVNCHSLSTMMANYPLTHNFDVRLAGLAALCPRRDEEVEWVSWPVCPSLCCHLIIITAKQDTDGTLSPVFRSSDSNIPCNRLQAMPAMPSRHLKMMWILSFWFPLRRIMATLDTTLGTSWVVRKPPFQRPINYHR